jgi:hypothetical protein
MRKPAKMSLIAVIPLAAAAAAVSPQAASAAGSDIVHTYTLTNDALTDLHPVTARYDWVSSNGIRVFREDAQLGAVNYRQSTTWTVPSYPYLGTKVDVTYASAADEGQVFVTISDEEPATGGGSTTSCAVTDSAGKPQPYMWCDIDQPDSYHHHFTVHYR